MNQISYPLYGSNGLRTFIDAIPASIENPESCYKLREYKAYYNPKTSAAGIIEYTETEDQTQLAQNIKLYGWSLVELKWIMTLLETHFASKLVPPKRVVEAIMDVLVMLYDAKYLALGGSESLLMQIEARLNLMGILMKYIPQMFRDAKFELEFMTKGGNFADRVAFDRYLYYHNTHIGDAYKDLAQYQSVLGDAEPLSFPRVIDLAVMLGHDEYYMDPKNFSYDVQDEGGLILACTFAADLDTLKYIYSQRKHEYMSSTLGNKRAEKMAVERNQAQILKFLYQNSFDLGDFYNGDGLSDIDAQITGWILDALEKDRPEIIKAILLRHADIFQTRLLYIMSEMIQHPKAINLLTTFRSIDKSMAIFQTGNKEMVSFLSLKNNKLKGEPQKKNEPNPLVPLISIAPNLEVLQFITEHYMSHDRLNARFSFKIWKRIVKSPPQAAISLVQEFSTAEIFILLGRHDMALYLLKNHFSAFHSNQLCSIMQESSNKGIYQEYVKKLKVEEAERLKALDSLLLEEDKKAKPAAKKKKKKPQTPTPQTPPPPQTPATTTTTKDQPKDQATKNQQQHAPTKDQPKEQQQAQATKDQPKDQSKDQTTKNQQQQTPTKDQPKDQTTKNQPQTPPPPSQPKEQPKPTPTTQPQTPQTPQPKEQAKPTLSPNNPSLSQQIEKLSISENNNQPTKSPNNQAVNSSPTTKQMKKEQEKIQKQLQFQQLLLKYNIVESELDSTIGKMKYCRKDKYIIGRGSNGTVVYKGLWSNQIPVAIKRMNKEFNLMDKVAEEVDLMIKLTNEQGLHIVRYIDREENDDYIYLAVSLCELSLLDWFEFADEKLPAHLREQRHSIDKKSLISDVIQGVAFLHKYNVVHNDLNPRNILVNNGRLVISDMGLSKMITAVDSFSLTHSPAGTGGYHPAEVILRDQRKTSAVDIFSLGCIICYLLSDGKDHPFGKDTWDRMPRIMKDMPNAEEALPKGTSNEAIDLITRCIIKDPSLRPNIQQVIHHPFFWPLDKQINYISAVYQSMKASTLPPTTFNTSIDPRGKTYSLLTEYHALKRWDALIDSNIMEVISAGVSSPYHYENVKDLFRCMRNAIEHHQEIKYRLQQQPSTDKKIEDVFASRESLFQYFVKQFPMLIVFTYHRLQSLDNYISSSPILQPYYPQQQNK
ncbi:putative protein serine/threonine kinase [Cavenderia fasciculata]|uniref:non-specific serine/threonine protein kinase n=1 Tax=Cavenderia fasciculata TaxID=261658 RepID=F4PU19_CACFS|nr:putative protein serine/threonine kinase [Cavenderia fasciculata]EGG21787.1 putative protein serine/threonine kinase [Cavenderia fasciculata]|eukprot:XP_004359637.1 putative protein serine/threonine kinase [Cavenderia fasciculata]